MASPTPQEPQEPENDLDEALEAIFDSPSTPAPIQNQHQPAQPSSPSTPPPTSIPQTPQSSPRKSPPKSILEHLADNQKRLSAGAARILEDLSKLTNQNDSNLDNQSISNFRAPVAEPPEARSRKTTIAEDMAARRTKKKKQPTKNAFAVIGRENPPDGIVHELNKFQYVDHNITNMSLTEAPYEQPRLEAIFEHTPRLDIADIKSRHEDIRMGALKDYTVFGCLVKKIFKKSARNGKMYAVWSLCNMPRGKYEGREVEPTVVRLLVFDNAFEAFHTRCEGTVFALRKPGLLPRRDGDSENLSQHALRISRKENVVVLGVCKDFKLCEIRRPGGELCGQWYDANRTTSCTPHMLKRRKAWTTGTRMDIQNAVRPHIRDTTRGLRPPTDISAMRGANLESTETGELDRKRRRDSQLARNLKRNKLVNARKTPRAVHANVQNGVKKNFARPDAMANAAREVKQVRNLDGERHARLLGRSDRQIRYLDACETLYGLGFKLKADGGWEPPERCDVTLVTTQTHYFSGLGKVKRRVGAAPGGRNGENDSSLDEEKNGSGHCVDDDDHENVERKEPGESVQGEDEMMEVESGKGVTEVKDTGRAIPMTGNQIASEKKAMKTEKDGEVASVHEKSSRVTLSVSNDPLKPQGEATQMDCGDATADQETRDPPQESSEATRAKPPVTEETDSQGKDNDIVLSDESEDD